MKNIIFRAKSVENGEWLHGYFYRGWVPSGGIESRIRNLQEPYDKLVDDETLGQFIGLYDEYGDEIYDGDYVEVNYKHEEMGENYGIIPDCDCICKGQVFWNEEELTWCIKILKAEEPIKSSIMENDGLNEYYLSAFDLECVRVLGNIYDNKDLIEL